MSQLSSARAARSRRARRLARLGAAKRKGDSAWGRAMARKSVSRRGGKARARHYPGLVKLWATNAARIRWNPIRVARGLPALPLLPVPKVMTPSAVAMREKRELERRRQWYDDQVAARTRTETSATPA